MKTPGSIVAILTVFVAGFLAGTAFTVWKMDSFHPTRQTADSASKHSSAEQIAALQKHLQENPQDGTAWGHLGNHYYDDGQPEKAIEAYQHALQHSPATANLLTDLGVMYRKTNQPEQAINYFDKAIEKDPGHLPSRFNKGVVLLGDLEKPRAAIAVWREILAIDPNATTGSGERIADIVAHVEKELALKGQAERTDQVRE